MMTRDTTDPFERYDTLSASGNASAPRLRAAWAACRPQAMTELLACVSDPREADELQTYRDLHEAPWLRELAETWPMLFHELYCSPEIMSLAAGPEVVAVALVSEGASCAAPGGDRQLPALEPFVLDWLAGRRWSSWQNDVVVRDVWTIALQAFGELGPDALPQDEQDLVGFLGTIRRSLYVFEQLGDHPARALGADGLRGLSDLHRSGLIGEDDGESLAEVIAAKAFGDDAGTRLGRIRSPEDIAAFRAAALLVLVPGEAVRNVPGS